MEDRLAALANREESEVKLAYEISLEDQRARFAAKSGSQGSVTNSHGVENDSPVVRRLE